MALDDPGDGVGHSARILYNGAVNSQTARLNSRRSVCYATIVDRSSWPTRKLRRDELPEDELVPGTPGERMMMVWQLTRDAWSFLGLSAEPEFRRDIVRTLRRGR
jgi:hypothetical protein